MSTLREPLNGGLVSSREPALLQAGELTQATNCFYYPDRDGICRSPGLSSWDVVGAAATVTGLTACRFDNGNHYLVAQSGTAYYTADAETDSSPFTSLTTVTAGGQLTSVQYDNRYYLFNGANANVVLQQDGTTRNHGLIAVPTGPSLIQMSASAFSTSVTGVYEYWHTEVVRFADNTELESAFNGKPLSVPVTGTAVAPLLEFPSTPANFGAGSSIVYRVYRSDARPTLGDDPLYPVGQKLADIPLVDSTGAAVKPVRYTDTTTGANTGAKTAGTNDTVIFETSSGITSSLQGGASSAADALTTAGDSKFIRISANSTSARNKTAVITLSNFSLGTITGNVIGIDIQVRMAGNVASIADMMVAVGERSSTNLLKLLPPNAQFPSGFGTGFTSGANGIFPFGSASRLAKKRTVTATVLASGDTTFGGSTDTWIPTVYSWTASQLTSSFAVQLGVIFNQAAGASDYVDIDYCRMIIYYTGTQSSVESSKLYDAIVVEKNGAELRFSSHGLPPTASTGCIFEGSLVTNDISQPSKIKWSIPGEPDYFPNEIYFNDLEGDDNDIITFLGTIQGRCIAGTKGALWRVNYLPSEDDASWRPGPAVEQISDTIGILRPTAACVYTGPDGRQLLAFVDTNGVFATDGYSIVSLLDDLRWVGSNGLFLALSSSIYTTVIALVNDPTTQTLRLVLTTGYYSASYAKRHLKPGLKWSGQTFVTHGGAAAPRSCTCLRRNTGAWIMVYGYLYSAGLGGDIWREDSTDTFGYNQLQRTNNILPVITTRDIHADGLGDEAEYNEVLIYGAERGTGTGAVDRSVAGTITATQLYENVAPATPVVLTLPTPITGCHLVSVPSGTLNSGGIRLKIEPSSADVVELYAIGLRTTSFGGDDSHA